MQTRTLLTLLTAVVGLSLAVVSYFFLAAPLGRPTDVSFSNPRLEWGAALFVLGVILTFSAAVVYEVYPERHK
jgi:uncharacterized BrkB/YihY/UPF0761 family membrane protein